MVFEQRKQIRLKKYNYSDSGWYFMTICTQNRECLLGNVINNKMILNKFGKIVDKKIKELTVYKNIEIDIYSVMQNHIHLILVIVGAAPGVGPIKKNINPILNIYLGSTQGSTPTIGEYVKRLKSLTTFIYIDNVKNNNWKPFSKRLWQRNYFEHIIRTEFDLNRIRQYIKNNPSNWNKDRNNLP